MSRMPVPQPSREERQWAMLCHYSAFFWLLVPMIGNVLGPLVIWQWKKEDSPFIDQQGREALNFQITYSLCMMVCSLLTWILIGFPLMLLLSLVAMVLVVIAGIRANEGRSYRYPLCWRPLK